MKKNDKYKVAESLRDKSSSLFQRIALLQYNFFLLARLAVAFLCCFIRIYAISRGCQVW